MDLVAKKESMEPEALRQRVARGEVAIPCNIRHTSISPEGIGAGLRTKINVNLGISGDCKHYDVEMQKVDVYKRQHKILSNWAFLSCQVSLKYKAERKERECMSDVKIRKLVLAALFTALCTIMTLVIQVPSPMQGYVNLGDCAVLLSAWILGPVYGGVAAGVGSMLADLLSGYAHYAPGTFLDVYKRQSLGRPH